MFSARVRDSLKVPRQTRSRVASFSWCAFCLRCLSHAHTDSPVVHTPIPADTSTPLLQQKRDRNGRFASSATNAAASDQPNVITLKTARSGAGGASAAATARTRRTHQLVCCCVQHRCSACTPAQTTPEFQIAESFHHFPRAPLSPSLTPTTRISWRTLLCRKAG